MGKAVISLALDGVAVGTACLACPIRFTAKGAITFSY
jgi:hypothetical protein